MIHVIFDPLKVLRHHACYSLPQSRYALIAKITHLAAHVFASTAYHNLASEYIGPILSL